jgi:hypothetical protein
VKVVRSISRRRERGRLAKDRGYRSHHPAHYRKKQPGPGRPKLSEHEKARRKSEKEAAKKRREKARQRAAQKRAEQKARGTKLRAARRLLALKHMFRPRREDHRKNHDPRYAYLAPKPRLRRTAKQVARWGHGHRKTNVKPGRPGAALLLVARAATKGLTRRLHLRGYWRQVKKMM